MYYQRHFLCASLIFLLINLLGCATTTELRTADLPSGLKVNSAQGVMAVKIVINRPELSFLFNKWQAINVKNIETKETFTIADKADGAAAYGFYVMSLPPGEYEIDSVKALASGWLTISQSSEFKNKLPSFTVNSGRLTDLGTLALIEEHYPFFAKKGIWTQYSAPDDNANTLQHFSPELAEVLRAAPINSWHKTKSLEVLQSDFSIYRTNTIRVMDAFLEDDGSLYMGESLGQIAQRSQNGHWHWIKLPSAQTVRTAYLSATGTLYAGMDHGVLLARPQGSELWQSIDLPEKNVSVLHVGRLPGSDELLVIMQARDKFIAVSRSELAKGQWREHFRVKRTLFNRPSPDSRGVVYHSPGHVTLAIGSPEIKIQVMTYSASEQRWKSGFLQESGFPYLWTAIPGGGLARFIGTKFAVSADDGLTWESRGVLKDTYGAAPLFVSDKVGYAIKIDSRPIFDNDAFKLSLWRTADGGNYWEMVGPTPTTFGVLLPLQGYDNLAYAGRDGKFFISKDGGKSWSIEKNIQ